MHCHLQGTFSLVSQRKFLTTVKKFETGVDEQSGIILKNSDDEMAVISLTMRAKQPKRGIVCGELGYITVENFQEQIKQQLHILMEV
ncbi:hypothetical protein DFR94_004515 [Clostridium beijerinckii]|nr:hypothetical protein [Clostridium beijerinckii]NRZ17617.1 hypothetical protein [Clostridium beijerinckii]